MRTPGPWFAHRTNWLGEPVEHKIYVSGNKHEIHEDEDDEDVVTGSIATAVAIVEGNATSRGVTEANARLIEAAPDLLAELEMLEAHFGDSCDHGILDMSEDYRRWIRIQALIAKVKGDNR